MQRQELAHAPVRLKVIGSIEAVDTSGKDVLPASHKASALLAYLAFNAGEWVPKSQMARLLWGQLPKKEGRLSLRQALRELMRSLGTA